MIKMRPSRKLITFIILYLSAGFAYSQSRREPLTPARPDARAYFVDLKDGAAVPSTLTVRFGATNIEIVPAQVAKPNSGHHHLLIDSPLPPLDQPIPTDPNHLHFGRGQTEAEIVLAAGEHTLQLVLGDHKHIPHNPPVVSEVIHVRVDPASVKKARTPAPQNAVAYFVGLEDGATIPTKSIIKFGSSGIEIVPTGTDTPNSGHHHLIVDSPLPDLSREIPNDLNHLHFGRGQTETELTLTPGLHTLQLLLGDREHVPHDPPIMSEMIHVTAVDIGSAKNEFQIGTGRTESPPDAAVYFIYPSNGAVIYPRSTIRFGLRNMGVAPAGTTKPNTGHHHLLIDIDPPPLDQKIPNDLNHLHFGAGHTEKKISLKPGKHTLQLILGDYDHVPHDPPVMSERIEVTVMGVRKRRRRP